MIRMRLQDLVLSLTRAHGTAALIDTHKLDEPLHLSDRLLLLDTAGPQRAGRHVRDITVPRPCDRRDAALAGVHDELLEGIAAASNGWA
jgi:sulfonate transport system ATP-binding protein